MIKKRLLWIIYLPMLVVIVTLMTGAIWFATVSFYDFHIAQVEKDLKIRAELLRVQIVDSFLSRDYQQTIALCNSRQPLAETRVTIIMPTGKVIYDSSENPAIMDNHATRPEIQEAYSGRPGKSIRYSNTLHRRMLYVALPLTDSSGPAITAAGPPGVLRLSIALTTIDETLWKIYLRIIASSILLVLIAALITLSVSRRITRPLEQIGKSAENYAQGNFSSKICFDKSGVISREVVDLADTFNNMAEQLDARIRTITKQHTELETIFAGMAEGILVIDMAMICIKANQSAAGLLGLSPAELENGRVPDLVANRLFTEFIEKVLSGEKRLTDEIVLQETGQEVHLQLHGTILIDEDGNKAGGIVVLHDISRLMQLENVRRDFVANVSHELKTPITTIRGFAETLVDGEYENPANVLRFITIIMKHADRLNAIVEDILTLSEIEQAGDHIELPPEPVKIRDILACSIEASLLKAVEKNITIQLQVEDKVTARVNELLMEQAVTNLIINAVKYSDDNSEVVVRGEQQDGHIAIKVIDFGIGIAPEHIPRLFERFYRSDKARSRKLGGTGLGLAIVKHIINAHGGQVLVTSTPGKGSIFTILIPAAPITPAPNN